MWNRCGRSRPRKTWEGTEWVRHVTRGDVIRGPPGRGSWRGFPWSRSRWSIGAVRGKCWSQLEISCLREYEVYSRRQNEWIHIIWFLINYMSIFIWWYLVIILCISIWYKIRLGGVSVFLFFFSKNRSRPKHKNKKLFFLNFFMFFRIFLFFRKIVLDLKKHVPFQCFFVFLFVFCYFQKPFST